MCQKNYRLKQDCRKIKATYLVDNDDFDNKLTSFNRRISSNKTKQLELLITKYYNFCLGGIYFTNNGGSQNTCVYQPILDDLQFKKRKVLIMF